MSDLQELTEKTKEGVNWRGNVRVTINDEEKELTIRQLTDPEMEEVMGLINRDELQELREQMPQDILDEYQDLQRQDDLDEEEAERFEELEEKLQDESPSIFEVLSGETFEGIRQCAKYAVEPDEEDMREAFMDRASEIEMEYGVKVQQPEDVKPALQDDIEFMIENSTDFTSFTVGIQALVESVGDEGN